MRAAWSDAGLRTRVRVAFLAVGAVGLVGLVFVGVTFGHLLDARHRLADRLDPATTNSRKWISAVVDQESGVRGYVLSGDETYLQPYDDGVAVAAAGERATRSLLADEPSLLAIVDRFDVEADRWRKEVAAPLVADTRAGAKVTEAQLSSSKASFDEVRATYRLLQDRLDVTRGAARTQLDRNTTDLVQATVVAVLVAALGLIATWIALNRWVIRPLGSLGADARLVASGDLEHAVDPVGPPDLEALAGDMEAMRRRIVDELGVVEAARGRLEAQASDLARSNQELEQFAYVASHDLQEPLRKITGFCQLLQRRYGGQLDERADEYIAFAVDGAKRMQVLINDLLAFSRVGRTTEGFAEVDLGVVAARAVTTLESVIEAAGATVSIGPLPRTQGDATLLELLFQNLVANAVKFHGDAPPVVAITAAPTDDGWELTCVDNGIGIEPRYAERVFVIFQRLNDREAYDGTGIGLAMCRKIVEFHGGAIRVVPTPDRPGTTIAWTLPTEVPRVPALPVAAPAPASPKEPTP
ncbi:ATP-binding protein [Aquihabitans sp. G128]|uniref:sensor histidine kinase n=1 Tax=Aquihabitans sp. G128 TaxID=2849779 RepID=UPI0020B2E7B6|nr:sensor histidine kinase [Aquihabitans sp. G128]